MRTVNRHSDRRSRPGSRRQTSRRSRRTSGPTDRARRDRCRRPAGPEATRRGLRRGPARTRTRSAARQRQTRRARQQRIERDGREPPGHAGPRQTLGRSPGTARRRPRRRTPARSSLAFRAQRSSFVVQEVGDRCASCQRLLARDDRDVRTEQVVQLEAARVVGRQHGRAGRAAPRPRRSAAPRAATGARRDRRRRSNARSSRCRRGRRTSTWRSTPAERAIARNSSSSGPVPQMTSRVSGCVRMTSFIASIR